MESQDPFADDRPALERCVEVLRKVRKILETPEAHDITEHATKLMTDYASRPPAHLKARVAVFNHRHGTIEYDVTVDVMKAVEEFARREANLEFRMATGSTVVSRSEILSMEVVDG